MACGVGVEFWHVGLEVLVGQMVGVEALDQERDSGVSHSNGIWNHEIQLAIEESMWTCIRREREKDEHGAWVWVGYLIRSLRGFRTLLRSGVR